jgi:hypothetical protein
MIRRMNDVDRALVALANSQRQVFTRRQAIEAGLSRSAVYRRVGTGLLVPHGPHTLHFGGATLDYRGRLLAGLLDLGDAALVSAAAAAALHGLDGFDEGPLHFLVPRSNKDRRTIGVVSSTPSIGRLDAVVVDGLRTTSGTRTVVELVGRVNERQLGNAIDSCIRLGLTAPLYLHRRLTELGRPGRAGVAMFDRVVESAGVQSWLERQFLALIRSVGVPKPAVQRVYRRDRVHVARVDFDFAPVPVVVEVGGRRGYLSAADRRRQEHRRNELQLLGKVVYFFTSEDVTDAVPYVIATLRAALGLAA